MAEQIKSPTPKPTLGFAWWNVQDFGHYTTSEINSRLPQSEAEYDEKLRRVALVINELKSKPHGLDLIGLAETTPEAAARLRDVALPSFEVLTLPTSTGSFSTSVLYRRGDAFTEQPPLVVPDMPRSARPMLVVDHRSLGDRVRFIFCHWVALETHVADMDRIASAAVLNRHIYDFLRDDRLSEQKHVVVMGDLNMEPFGDLEEKLNIGRSRSPAQRRAHYTDNDRRRVRLYNCTWRLLGEQVPHELVDEAHPSAAGTVYSAQHGGWKTFDHLIATGGLLRIDRWPRLLEQTVSVHASLDILNREGVPAKFEAGGGGVSDHLPIYAAIEL